MKKKLVIGGICFLIGAAVAFFGVQFVLKTGMFKVPGKLVFTDEILDSEAEKYREALAEVELDKDVVFSEFYDGYGKDALVTDVLVPVADFYEPKESITAEEFEKRLASGEGVKSVLKLDETMKLMAVEGEYYLETFSTGATYKYLRVEGENAEDVKKVEEVLRPMLPELPSKDTVLSFTQTGVTALARGMNAKMAEVGDGKYFAANIGEYLAKFDLTHTSNESSFSGYASSSNICSDARFIDTLLGIGLDVVELTGNHNVDCGAEDAIRTFEQYQQLGIKTVGGGRNATEAEVPLQLSLKGTNITMLAYNQSTGGATTSDYPGANQYYAENAQQRIDEAKAHGDFVVVDVQFNECNFYDDVNENTTCDRADSAPGDQVGLFRSLIDMGANVVVGTSAHQTQTYERYNGGEIYYGLGNIFFDQVWWPGTTRSLGLTHYFWKNKLLQTRRFGTIYDASYRTRLMNEEEIEWFINRLNQAR
ncbi:CapA family protein [Candidatus Saccharibacteria bacterium]|nr:CapA family protein [Candidatus Saccharibacteria bacterium]MBR6122116.1 CapA family protein [Candidatus Saccharibacteria bacterium]